MIRPASFIATALLLLPLGCSDGEADGKAGPTGGQAGSATTGGSMTQTGGALNAASGASNAASGAPQDAGGAPQDASGGAPQDAGGGAAGATGESAFGMACQDHANCGAPTDYCAKAPGQRPYCTASGCDADASLCPEGWTCFDIGQFAPGQPHICRQPM